MMGYRRPGTKRVGICLQKHCVSSFGTISDVIHFLIDFHISTSLFSHQITVFEILGVAWFRKII